MDLKNFYSAFDKLFDINEYYYVYGFSINDKKQFELKKFNKYSDIKFDLIGATTNKSPYHEHYEFIAVEYYGDIQVFGLTSKHKISFKKIKTMILNSQYQQIHG